MTHPFPNAGDTGPLKAALEADGLQMWDTLVGSTGVAKDGLIAKLAAAAAATAAATAVNRTPASAAAAAAAGTPPPPGGSGLAGFSAVTAVLMLPFVMAMRD